MVTKVVGGIGDPLNSGGPMVEAGNAWVVNGEDDGIVDQAVLWLRNKVAPVLKWTCALMERVRRCTVQLSRVPSTLALASGSDQTRTSCLSFLYFSPRELSGEGT